MYVAERYRMSDDEARRRLTGPCVGNLITFDPVARRPVATFLPWAFVPDPDRLVSHVGRVNGQWRHSGPALIVIDGLQGPVRAEWRAACADGRSSPGLDFETVHLWGELAADDSLAAVLDSWDRLMEGHETGLRIADMDQDYLAAHAKAVVAVTFHITEIQGKSKLSQGESAADLDVIVQEMRAACPALAGRLADVAVPYVRRRDAAVAEARHARIVAMAQRIAGRGGNEAG